jgi:TPR repeat protein
LESGKYIGKDVSRAAFCYELAALLGNCGSRADYAFCLAYGLGVEQDIVAAVRQYRLSVEQGSTNGGFQLSLSLQYGIGCDVDLEEAASCWRDSAAQIDSVHLTGSFRCLRSLGKAESPVFRLHKVANGQVDILQHYGSIRPAAFSIRAWKTNDISEIFGELTEVMKHRK